ncbi:AraC family transcriptional regulator [uncultured Sanguibacteroides sp.]|uniref:AraC family transcriptional regulator n=1 Tax=uncultured Sanguibacteroides sp. TaxID=1635151 RepID=UPI0025F1BF68|nr:AraC family transcriptional regulator [uncultured Sanguibacteroides sp.]
MIGRELMEAIAFSVPVVCAMACMVMLVMDASLYRRNPQERGLRLFLALTYFITSLGWLGLVLYAAYPEAFIYYQPMFLLTLMLDQVMFCRFVSVVTGTGNPRRFSWLHWIIPVLITALSAIGYTLVPAGSQVTTVYREDVLTPGTWFNVVYITTTIVFVVYNTLYPLLSLRNIRHYRRFIVDYSSDEQRTSLGWLAAMQALILVSVPIPLAGLLIGIPAFSTSGFVWLGVMPTFAFYVILCYNMLADNYLIVRPGTEEEDTSGETAHKAPEKATAPIPLDRRRLERYLRDKKPYMNPNLRITDLAVGLNTNRSYLSAFINTEYGMNFCRLINKCRLHALDRLRISPTHADKTNMELVLMAGFSSYQNYLRVKTKEDKLSLLKDFER